MKIVLIAGQSGVGKTTICKELCKNTDKYNFIYSYTDREMREYQEWGHTFVESSYMDMLFESTDIAAKSSIDGQRYCALKSQFDENKINVYIVDINGINDIINTYSRADIMTILIRRSSIDADCLRLGRNVCIPARDDVDFIIDNDHKVRSAVGVINTLVNFDLFNKPSHVVESINDKLDYIEEQERHLTDIKESILYQLWEANYHEYKQLLNYIDKNINDEFDFSIKIEGCNEPEICEGCLRFIIIAVYSEEDTTDWATISHIVERVSYYAHEYCKDNKCDDIMYRMSISTMDTDEYYV